MFFIQEFLNALWYFAYIAFIGIGIVLYLISKFAKFLPTFGVYQWPAEIAGILLIAAGAWLGGGFYNDQAWEEKVHAANERADKAERKARIVNTEIKIEYQDRVRTITETKEVIKKEIEKVKEYIDKECTVTPEAIKIHNDAAMGKVTEKKK